MGPSGALGSIAVTEWPARARARASLPFPATDLQHPPGRVTDLAEDELLDAPLPPAWLTHDSGCSPSKNGVVRGTVHYRAILPRMGSFGESSKVNVREHHFHALG